MSLITEAEAAAEKVFHAVEDGVEDVDGEALRIARALLADAKEAEQKVLALAVKYKAELLAIAEKVLQGDAPAIEAALVALGERILADITGLFGASG
jgi:hypothetical protein